MMMDLEEVKQKYVDMLDVLFDGAVQAETYQITPEVISHINSMLNGITDCHMKLREFAALFHGLAKMLEDMIPSFGSYILSGEPLEVYLRKNGFYVLVGELINSATDEPKSKAVANFLFNFARAWIDHTITNKRLQLCINKARVNWRSTIQIALYEA